MHKPSRRIELRERTAKSHQELDALVGAFDSDASYHRYLIGTAAFRPAIEQVLAQSCFPEALGGYRLSPVGREVMADMEDLGLSAPPLVAVEECRSADAALGLLYVLEGSALGARLLVKRAAALGFDQNRGARHLARQASSLDSWRNYLEALERADPFVMDDCAAAALAAFDAARLAFGAPEHA